LNRSSIQRILDSADTIRGHQEEIARLQKLRADVAQIDVVSIHVTNNAAISRRFDMTDDGQKMVVEATRAALLAQLDQKIADEQAALDQLSFPTEVADAEG
jgi:hypothetical protein